MTLNWYVVRRFLSKCWHNGERHSIRSIGTTQSVTARLEDADYEGHSLNMLNRIASAVNKRVDIRFLGAKASSQLA